jgi:hypothetical protein
MGIHMEKYQGMTGRDRLGKGGRGRNLNMQGPVEESTIHHTVLPLKR